MQNVYISTPIYYVNDSPHIGHAYTNIVSDVLARFMKLRGNKVFVSTGTDEHGQKIEKTAKALNMHPQELAEAKSNDFRQIAELLNFKYNAFIRTTSEEHKKSALALWNILDKKEEIYLSEYEGWYSIRDESFYREQDLVNGLAPTGAPVEWLKEQSYFFKLSKWQDKLLEMYSSSQQIISPKSKQNEVISFIKSELRDLSISRSGFSWGISVPNDKNHVMYVWIEALSNYLTSTGFPNVESDLYQSYWSQDSMKIHVIGKDILKFHAVYWPAFLMAANLPIYDQIIAHGWWTNCGQKISKSLGNTINPFDLVSKFGVDRVRYFLMKEIPFGEDGDFSEEKLTQKVTTDLSNNIGNLVQRVSSMIHKECNGAIPMSISTSLLPNAELEFNTYTKFMNEYEFHRALELPIKLSSRANELINASAPWSLAKTNRQEMQNILYTCSEYIRIIGMLLQPFIPSSSEMILDQIGLNKNSRSFNSITDSLHAGIQIPIPRPIFPR